MSQATSPVVSARSSPVAPTRQASMFPTQALALIQAEQWKELMDLAEQHELDDLGLTSNDSELYFLIQMIVPFILDEPTAAKFAWKRTASSDARTRYPTLSDVWKSLIPLYQHDNQTFFSSFSPLLQRIESQESPFASVIAQLLTSLHSTIQQRAFQSICRIYDIISLDTACSMTGLSQSEMTNEVTKRGWTTVSNEKGTFVKPTRPPTDTAIHLAKDELSRLTTFVTALDLTVEGAK